MTTIRIDPQSLKGPRAYFTAWDYRIARSAKAPQLAKRSASRKLKALLLIKSRIAFAASHLDSSIAQSILMDEPRLLSDGILLPALRADRASLEDAVSDPTAKAIIRGRDTQVITWQLQDNTEWFRARLLEELENDSSAVRRLLGRAAEVEDISLFLSDLRGDPDYSRESIERASKRLNPKGQQIMQNFANLLYHISGARVVGCESALPQENYIDFDLSDLQGSRDRLTDEVVLLKLFIEQAFATLQRQAIPFETLDMLSFQDVLAVREPLMDGGFMQQYDQLVNTALMAVMHPGERPILLTLNELEKGRIELERTFRQVLEQEVGAYLARKTRASGNALLSPAVSVGLGVAGLVPVVGTAASLISLLKDTGSLGQALASVINTQRIASSAGDAARLRELQEERAEAMRKKIAGSEVGSRGLFEFVDQYAAMIREKLAL